MLGLRLIQIGIVWLDLVLVHSLTATGKTNEMHLFEWLGMPRHCFNVNDSVAIVGWARVDNLESIWIILNAWVV